MTIILVDGPIGSGKTALVDTLIDTIPYAKVRHFSGEESISDFTTALNEDIASDTLFPLITIWFISWVTGWARHGLTTEDADQLDTLFTEAEGIGIILLGDEDIVDEDERDAFEEYAEDPATWFIVEEGDSEDLIAQVRTRLSL